MGIKMTHPCDGQVFPQFFSKFVINLPFMYYAYFLYIVDHLFSCYEIVSVSFSVLASWLEFKKLMTKTKSQINMAEGNIPNSISNIEE
jgi:hypothetical protein